MKLRDGDSDNVSMNSSRKWLNASDNNYDRVHSYDKCDYVYLAYVITLFVIFYTYYTFESVRVEKIS